jgi:phage tail sheath protein FI
MATSYSTPGVYVVEQSAFPPSVAQVPTAIPAFVGYTQLDTFNKAHDLNLSPTKISSLLEYQTLYGGAPETIISNVDLSASNSVASESIVQSYYMYDALQMFYANGGGDCYIVSVNLYGAVVSETDLKNGIDTLKKKDEPSLLLFPDATELSESNFYDLQKYALLHCATLQNRFSILDTFYSGNNDIAFGNYIDNYRTGLGVNNLSYGAAYTPWLNSNIPGAYTYENFSKVITKLGISIPLSSLTTDATVSQLISDYDSLIADTLKINTAIENLLGIVPTNDINKLDSNVAGVLTKYQTDESAFKLDAANPAPALATIEAEYKKLFDDVYKLAELLDSLLATSGVVTADLRTDINGEVNTVAASAELAKMVTLDNTIHSNNGYIGTTAGYPVRSDTTVIPDVTDPTKWASANLRTTLNTATALDTIFLNNSTTAGWPGLTAAQQVANMGATETSVVAKAYFRLYTSLSNIVTYLETAMATKESGLYLSFPIYQGIRDTLNNAVTLIPPSGAVAGAYAYTDNTRGVWKAPANISLASVNAGSGVSFDITDDVQGGLNVDVTGGKSINAIRDFTGKGTLIWGARTLAGNDEDWRYVPVRRFCIMVEQSVKKSISWAVFEPNDANTWAKVKGMIENFLTLQWRAGALQGAKPTDAFVVSVGLGLTMTAQDILDGIMRVQVKMAVVHPAEFIILTFTQMMATS